MPIISGGFTRSTAAQPWQNADRWTPGTGLSSTNGFGYDGAGAHPLTALGGHHLAYDAIFEQHLWPNVAIRKLTSLQLQLPMKVYQRRRRGRDDARRTPFGQLMAKPSSALNPFAFWRWFVLCYHIHGRAFALKGRDAGGRPVELALIHPTRMRYGPKGGGWAAPGADGMEGGGNSWWFCRKDGTEFAVDRASFIYWAQSGPRSPASGMSQLEPLRDTLELEAAARVANKSLYLRGGKHSMILKTPKNFGNGTSAVLMRLADQYEARHGGALNWGRPLILEDGMDAMPLDQSPKDMEYVLARQLNRTEVAAAFDIPPPAIGQLEHATFSNVTEQNRMLYRLTMPPHLQSFESMIDFDLRDGSFGDGPPDFGEAFYFEHLIDGVLRGSTEERIAANAQAIQTGQMMPSESREMENRPYVPGSDRLFINTAMAPLDALDQGAAAAPALPAGAPVALAKADRSAVMGRLGRLRSLDDIDGRLTAGLPDEAAAVVMACAAEATSVADLKDQIKRMGVQA